MEELQIFYNQTWEMTLSFPPTNEAKMDNFMLMNSTTPS